MPTAFMAKSDEEADVAAVWGDVWEDSGSSAAASLRLYMADILPLLIQGMALKPPPVELSSLRWFFVHC